MHERCKKTSLHVAEKSFLSPRPPKPSANPSEPSSSTAALASAAAVASPSPASPSMVAQFVPMPNAAPDDWSVLDQYVVSDPNLRYKRVVNIAGEVLGQLQPMSGCDSFRAFVLCKQHKPRCSRSRGWRASSGEDPNMVFRVLAHWCLCGAASANTGEHMALTRF